MTGAMESVSSTLRTTAAASTTPATTGATTTTPAAGSTTAAPSFAEQLKQAGTKVQPVKGHAWSKVMDGEHKGTYVNRSHNARAGEAFDLVRRDGRTFHVYGEGDKRVVVELPSAAKTAAGKTPAKDATTTSSPTQAGGTQAPAA